MPYTDADVTALFNNAAAIVKAWGRNALPDGRSLEEALTIKGISFWSAVAPMLCVSHVSQMLKDPARASNVKQTAMLAARKLKYAVRDLYRPWVSNKKGCEDWPTNPSFLFLGFSYYIYRETLQSVALRIANRPGYSAVVLNVDSVFRQSQKRAGNEIVQSLFQHWNQDVSQAVRAMQRTYRASMVQSWKDVRKMVESTGIPWGRAQLTFDWLFKLLVPQLIISAAIALDIVERHRPLLLLSPDVNDPRTRIFCLAGKLVGIQTLEVQHGCYTEDCPEWQFFIADHLAVTGEKNLQVMRYHGIPAERMTVTGAPRFDKLLSLTAAQ
jgi:hypothetical protein